MHSEASKYVHFFKRSALIEGILTVVWFVLANLESEKTLIRSSIAWAITACLGTMCCLHIALLQIKHDWRLRLGLAYSAFYITICTTILLFFHVFLAARTLATPMKISKYIFFLFILVFWIFKAVQHTRFIFELRRFKYEEDLALYRALSNDENQQQAAYHFQTQERR